MLTVQINDKPLFTWEGTKTEIENVMDAFPSAATTQGVEPTVLATSVLQRIMVDRGKLLPGTAASQEFQMMALTWLILSHETGNPERPGKIVEYAGYTDFDANIVGDDVMSNISITATSRFNA
jgi:hypothetical protein